MNCPENEKLMSIVEGSGEFPSLEKHIETCEECAARVDRYRSVEDLLAERGDLQVDETFTTRVMNEVRYLQEEERARQTRPATGSLLGRVVGFLQRNSSWMASLSLHGAVFFAFTFFILTPKGAEKQPSEAASREAVRQFDRMPEMSTIQYQSEEVNYEEQALWKMDLRRNRLISEERLRRISESGGTTDVNNTIQQTLRLLANRQRDDGSWTPGNKTDNRIRTTALSTLAFLHNGHVPGRPDDRYGNVVKKAVDYLIEQQANSGCIGPGSPTLTSHAAATTVLMEYVLLSQDPMHYKEAKHALNHLIEQQIAGGLWKEIPVNGPFPEDGVSLWHIISLRLGVAMGVDRASSAAHNLLNCFGLRDRPDKLDTLHLLAHNLFVPSRQLPDRLRHHPESAATGSSLPDPGKNRMNEDLMANTYALLQTGGPAWKTWNNKLLKTLPRAYRVSDTTTANIARYTLCLQSYYAYPAS